MVVSASHISTQLLILILGFLLMQSKGEAQESSSDPLPIYTAEDLRLDTAKLRPHRVLYDPRDGIGGFEDGLFADGVYPNPQISITMDRTVYYDGASDVHDAIRVRWVSNTHPHTDEIVVDAKTLATVNERTRAGRNWETKDEVVHIRDAMARVMTLADNAEPILKTFPLQHEQYYGLMILPYLFASMDVPDGANFQLPAVGSESESYIEVEVVGQSSYTNASADCRDALLVRSKHPWGAIDWYVNTDSLPYHAHAIWQFGPPGSKNTTTISKVIDWVEFEADVYNDTVDPQALKQITSK